MINEYVLKGMISSIIYNNEEFKTACRIGGDPDLLADHLASRLIAEFGIKAGCVTSSIDAMALDAYQNEGGFQAHLEREMFKRATHYFMENTPKSWVMKEQGGKRKERYADNIRRELYFPVITHLPGFNDAD